MKKESTSNTFENGLVLDYHELVVPTGVYTDALNASFITFNGNEYVMQNDMGNALVKYAKLPKGFIPIGTCELGGIIYIASYNPLENIGLVGSFPSPLRIFVSEASENEFDKNKFFAPNVNGRPFVINTSLVVPLNTTLHPGDKYVVSMSGDDVSDELITDYKNQEPKINLAIRQIRFKLVGIINNKVQELSNYKWYASLDNGYYFISDNGTELPYSIFDLTLSGELAVLANLEIIENFLVLYRLVEAVDNLNTTYYKLKLGFNWSYKKNEEIDDRSSVNPVYFTCTINGATYRYINETTESTTNYPILSDVSDDRVNDGTDEFKWYELDYKIYPVNSDITTPGLPPVPPLNPIAEQANFTPVEGDELLPFVPDSGSPDLTPAVIIKPPQHPFVSPTEVVLSKNVLDVVVYPEMSFGKLVFMKKTFHIDRSKLNNANLDLELWKYSFPSLNNNELTILLEILSYVNELNSIDISFAPYDSSFAASDFSDTFTENDYNRNWVGVTLVPINGVITDTLMLDDLDFDRINVCKIHAVITSEHSDPEHYYFYRIIYPKSTALKINSYYDDTNEFKTINGRKVRISDFNNLYLSDVIDFEATVRKAPDHIGFRETDKYTYTDVDGNIKNPYLEEFQTLHMSKEIEYGCHKYVDIQSDSEFSVIANKGTAVVSLLGSADSEDIAFGQNSIRMYYSNGELTSELSKFVARIPFRLSYNGMITDTKEYKLLRISTHYIGIYLIPDPLNPKQGEIKLFFNDSLDAIKNYNDFYSPVPSEDGTKQFYTEDLNRVKFHLGPKINETDLASSNLNFDPFKFNVVVPTVIAGALLMTLAKDPHLFKYTDFSTWSFGSPIFSDYNDSIPREGDGLHWICLGLEYNETGKRGVFPLNINNSELVNAIFGNINHYNGFCIKPNDLNTTLNRLDQLISSYGVLIDSNVQLHKISSVVLPNDIYITLNLKLTLTDFIVNFNGETLNSRINNFKIETKTFNIDEVDISPIDTTLVHNLLYNDYVYYILKENLTDSVYLVSCLNTPFAINPDQAIYKYDANNDTITLPNTYGVPDSYFSSFNKTDNNEISDNAITVKKISEYDLRKTLKYNTSAKAANLQYSYLLSFNNVYVQVDLLIDNNTIS